MKTIINKVLFALLILTSIIILGIFVPTTFSLLISTLTPATFSECVMTIPFWLFTIIGVIMSSCYINEEVKKLD